MHSKPAPASRTFVATSSPKSQAKRSILVAILQTNIEKDLNTADFAQLSAPLLYDMFKAHSSFLLILPSSPLILPSSMSVKMSCSYLSLNTTSSCLLSGADPGGESGAHSPLSRILKFEYTNKELHATIIIKQCYVQYVYTKSTNHA